MGRGERKTDSKRYYDWMYYAYCDRFAAEMLSSDKRLYSMAAFHCQQCIEKALKAYLLYKHRKLMDGHNLTWLCKQAALTDSGFAGLIPGSTALGRYYIETRYPADILLEIDRQTLDGLMSDMREMLEFIGEQMKFDLNSYHKKIRKK